MEEEMKGLKFDFSNALIQNNEYQALKPYVAQAHRDLHEGTGLGNDYIGWVNYPELLTDDLLSRVEQMAERIRQQAEVLIVVGIGGSYLGAKTVIDALTHHFYNELPAKKRKGPKIYFAGHQMSGSYLAELLDLIENQEVAVNVISKSGTTTEPAIAFRFLKKALEEKYGKEEAAKRIYATTDAEKGALRTLAQEEGYETFVIPDDVGGRYSVFTPVGLLPIASVGIDIRALTQGVKEAFDLFSNENVDENPCYQYAVLRNILYRRGKLIEVMVNYEPSMAFLGDWWIQLYGESEGKDGKGIFPAKMNNSTDLHSMGQMIQDGMRNIFETVIKINRFDQDLIMETADSDLDGLNYLAGKGINEVNAKAFQGTLEAHLEGQVPNLIIEIEEKDAYHMGMLLYFFMKACGISGYLLGVNPFDQPGVEAYKKNMFRLLGKK